MTCNFDGWKTQSQQRTKRAHKPALVGSVLALVGSFVPVVALASYCTFISRLNETENLDFLINGPQWPSLVISLMAVAVVLLALWHAIRYRATLGASAGRWILALLFFQVLAAICYWIFHVARAWRCSRAHDDACS